LDQSIHKEIWLFVAEKASMKQQKRHKWDVVVATTKCRYFFNWRGFSPVCSLPRPPQRPLLILEKLFVAA